MCVEAHGSMYAVAGYKWEMADLHYLHDLPFPPLQKLDLSGLHLTSEMVSVLH